MPHPLTVLRRPGAAAAVAVACFGAVVTAAGAPPGAAAADPAAAARLIAAGTWLDLTHPFDAATISWPTEPGFRFEPGTSGTTAKGYYYAANRFATAEHCGTHLDAPRHFAEGRHTVDLIEPERLVGEAAVIDVTAACAGDDVYEVTVDDLVGWETRHRRQLVDVIVLLRTGWAARRPCGSCGFRASPPRRRSGSRRTAA